MNTRPKIQLKRRVSLPARRQPGRKVENPELAKKRLMKLATAIKKVTRQLDGEVEG